MAQPTVAMSSEFLRWYRAVELDQDLEKLQNRWIGVEALAKKVTRADVEAMIRIAFRTKQLPASHSLEDIRKVFKEADSLFEMYGNSRELEVLCSAGLVAILENGDEVGAAAALAITTAGLSRSQIGMPQELTALADRSILRIAESYRKRPDLTKYAQADLPKLEFGKAMEKVREQVNWEGVAVAFSLAAEATRNAISQITQRTNRAIAAANKVIAIQDEELQMLWWLFGQRSWDLNCTFTAIPPNAQPLVLSKELAQTTEFLPGPVSVKPLLSRAGLKESGKLTIPKAVNACDVSWLTQLVEESNPSPVTLPIHSAIRRKLETGETEAWVAGWAAATEIAATYALSPLTLGILFYRERLLTIFPED